MVRSLLQIFATAAFCSGWATHGFTCPFQYVYRHSSIAKFNSKSESNFKVFMGSNTENETPSKVLLVGPSLFQLVLAKTCMAAGIEPLLVCPTSKMESFKSLIVNGLDEKADENGEYIMSKALYGLPEESDPEGYGWREGITAVVVCAEDAVINNKALIDTVMKWDGYGSDRSTAIDGPRRAILCAPLTSKVNKEKSMGWMPIFNNDKNEQKVWDNLVKSWYSNDYVSGTKGNCQSNVMRFGSMFGGGVDGPPELTTFGLNEKMYKMSLEQYRDLRERSFDRFRLSAQVLEGDTMNIRPTEQDEIESKSLKGTDLEMFRASGGYPEVDRTNRHTLAQAVVEALRRPARGSFATGDADDGSVPAECTILSKAISALPTQEEWTAAFRKPSPATWPNPEEFVAPTLERVDA